MSKEFKSGNTYVFTTKKYKKDGGKVKNYNWAKKCNGREVLVTGHTWGRIGGFGICSDWCKCIKVGVK